jgi:lipopolysaccharide export system protein LptC
MAQPGPRGRLGPPADAEAKARRARLAVRARERRVNRSYSRIVGILKILLPAIAVLVMATAVLWPYFNPEQLETLPAAENDVTIAGGNGEISQPRYFGVDEQGRPYEVTATSARRADGEGERYDIVEPTARLTLDDGTTIDAKAGTGLLDRDRGLLFLSNGVHLRRADGTELTSEHAVVNLDGKSASGDAAVTADGPFGQLSASGFRVEDEGRVVVFTGPAQLDLNSTEEKQP